jgi:hypothetical protein
MTLSLRALLKIILRAFRSLRSALDCLGCQVQGFHRAALPVERHGAGLHHRNAKQVHVALIVHIPRDD